MLALAVPAARLAQFAGALVLFGAPLFHLYAPGWAKGAPGVRRLHVCAGLVLLGGLVQLSVQTAAMTGAPADAARPGVWLGVLTDTRFGHGLAARLLLALASILALVAVPASRARAYWVVLTLIGGAMTAGFAWTGHGVADEGAAGMVHLLADVVHLLAAGVWIGALASLALALVRLRPAEDRRILHGGLAGFSGVGTGVVALLLLTGLVNSWFLVGPSHLADLTRTPYGLVLLAKILLFVLMLCAAAANRILLTPHLSATLESGEAGHAAVRSLRASVLIETGLALGVLVAVSALGVLEPLIGQ